MLQPPLRKFTHSFASVARRYFPAPIIAFQIPINGTPNSFLKFHSWQPADLMGDSTGIDCVPLIVTRAILDELDQLSLFVRVPTETTRDLIDDRRDDFEVGFTRYAEGSVV